MFSYKGRYEEVVRGTWFIVPEGQRMKSMTSGKFGNVNKTNWKQMDNGELISYYKSSCFKEMLNLFLVPGSILKRTFCISEEVDNKEIKLFWSLWDKDLFTQMSEAKFFKFSY